MLSVCGVNFKLRELVAWDTLVHYRDYVFNRIFAVTFEPLGDYCIQTVNVKCHKILSVRFGNTKPFEYRLEDMIKHFCVGKVKSKCISLFRNGAE